MAPQLQAAAARAVVTPPVGITHGHWGAQTHTRAVGVDLDLWATALVVSDGQTQIAIVDVDHIGYPDFLVSQVKEAITRLTGIPASHIRLSCSHSHSTGSLTPAWFTEGREMIPAHVAALPDRIAGAVWEAQRGLRPARIAAGRGTSNVGVNRRLWHPEQKRIFLGRNYEGFVDHEMPVARIDDQNEQPIAVMVSYSCHPTIMAHLNALITPDYPGVLRRTVEEVVGGKCLILQGAPGNVHPKETFSSKVEDYHRVGRILGLEAARVALELETRPRVERLVQVLESGAELGIYADEPGPEPDATLRLATRTIQLPLVKLPTVAEAEADFERKAADLAAARNTDDENEIRWKSMLARRAQMRLRTCQNYSGQSAADLELQAIRIGGLALVCLPGEPFAEIGVEVRRRSPFRVTMFSGYSNGQFAYIPVRKEYELGGYGVAESPVAPGGAEHLIEEASALLQELV